MPLPLGHTAIGLALYEGVTNRSAFEDWKTPLAAALLANLPDVDVFLGLLWAWNGSAFHRGPTHSLLFALVAALLYARAAALWKGLPRIGFGAAFLLVVSHVAADGALSSSGVSWFWPLAVFFSQGSTGWGEVTRMALKSNPIDAALFFAAFLVFALRRGFLILRAARAPVLPRGNLRR